MQWDVVGRHRDIYVHNIPALFKSLQLLLVSTNLHISYQCCLEAKHLIGSPSALSRALWNAICIVVSLSRWPRNKGWVSSEGL